jgi:restriction endonuclease Mrr
MTLLDDLSGLEFETKMTTAFEKYDGYHNVRQTQLTGDEGRDILMRETVNGHERAVVVECKHKDQVGREDVQKLHSAVITHNYPGPTRGMVVTSGRFSPQAREYVGKVYTGDDGTEIELVDGAQLEKIAAEIGMDIRNGKFKLVCDHTLSPVDPAGDIETPIGEQFDAIANIDAHDRPASESTIRFQPVVSIQTQTDSVCKTPSNNKILRRLSERDEFLLDGTQTPPASVEDSLRDLLTTETPQMRPLSEWEDTNMVNDTTVERFAQAENDYEEWITEQLQSKHAETVPYTGNNNIDYTEDCVPDSSEISMTMTPMRVPRVRSQIQLQEYEYTLEYDAAGAVRHMVENELAHCVHCGWSWLRLTYCGRCGAIACWRHTKTERLDGEPICTGCAVTARFGLRKRYFSSESNCVEFRTKYDGMALSRKALENWPWIVSTALVLIGLLVVLLI